VPLIRVFALVLFGLGLFVQSAAQAAAAPAVEVADIVPCSEMSSAMMEKMADEGPSEERPCDQMTLDCLIAMGCLAPIAMPRADSAELAVLRTARSTFRPSDLAGLKGRLLTPESPPPQTNLDI
jgi:hypothetical protein